MMGIINFFKGLYKTKNYQQFQEVVFTESLSCTSWGGENIRIIKGTVGKITNEYTNDDFEYNVAFGGDINSLNSLEDFNNSKYKNYKVVLCVSYLSIKPKWLKKIENANTWNWKSY